MAAFCVANRSRLFREAQTTGSFGGALHRGWMDLKAAITRGDERAILADCKRGETAALSAYQEALEHEELPDHVRRAIRQQFVALTAAHHRIHVLRERFADRCALD